MTAPHPLPVATDEPVTAESYPTFWEPIAVESPVAAPEGGPAAALLDPPADAYSAFLATSEDGRPSSLHVEQTDVG